MTQPPDWATNVTAQGVHHIPAVPAAEPPPSDQLKLMCMQLLKGKSFFSGMVDLGESDNPSAVGNLANGTQTFADTLCGFGTGVPSTGTTPQSILSAAEVSSDAVANTPVAAGLIDMGQEGGPAPNLFIDGLNGGQSFADRLCGFMTGNPSSSGSSPQSLLDGAQDVTDSLYGSPMGAGLIDMGQESGSSGNLAIDGINGTQSFADALCSFSRGNNSSGASPESVIDGVADVRTAVDSNPLSRWVLQQGQRKGSSNNLFIDGIRGAQQYDNTLYNVWSRVPVLANDYVSDTANNVLVDFKDPSSVVEEEGWAHDATVGHGPIKGSAKLIVDGLAENELLSVELGVSPGQKLSLAVWVRWTGLTYTGTDPITLGVTYYTREASGMMGEIGAEDLVSFATPTTNSSNPSEDNFIQLAVPDYMVPDFVNSAEPQQIRLRFKVGANVSAGTVWWDDATMANRTSVVNSITNPLFGFDNNATFSWNIFDAFKSLFAQNQAVMNSATEITALWAMLTAGASMRDDFNRSAVNLGSNWDEHLGSGNGNWYVDNGVARWNEAFPWGDRDSLNRWQGIPNTTTTDYQTIHAILGSAPEKGSFGVDGTISVIGRVNSATTDYIAFKCTGLGQWALTRCLGGTETTLASGDTDVPGAGSVITLICGDKDNSVPRYYTCKINNRVIASGDFGDTTSNFGASNRFVGFAGRAEGVLFLSQRSPSKVNAWAAQDT